MAWIVRSHFRPTWKKIPKKKLIIYVVILLSCCRGSRKKECRTEFWDCRDTSNTKIIGSWARWSTTTSGREDRGDHESWGKENTVGMNSCSLLYKAPSTLRWRNLKTEVSLWKRIKCFPLTLRRSNLETQQSPVILDLCLRKTRSGKSREYRDVIVIEKLRFQNVFRPHENAKPAFSNSSGLKSVFKKLRLCDGLVWTEGLTGEIKLCFQISQA